MKKGTFRSVSVLTVAYFLSAALGLFSQLLIAKIFGVGKYTDALFMSLTIPFIFIRILLLGHLSAVFMPIFMKFQAEGKLEDGWKYVSKLLSALILIVGASVAVLMILSPVIISLIAPGYDSELKALTIKLTLILLPGLLFSSLASVFSTIMNAFKRFSVPAILELIIPIATILSLIFLSPKLGVFSFALGSIAGSFITVVLLYKMALKLGMNFKFKIDLRDSSIRETFKLVVPFFASAGSSQAIIFSSRLITSFLPVGSLTILSYAEKICEFIADIFGVGIPKVTYPELSKEAASKNYASMRQIVDKSVKLMSFFTVPVTLFLILTSEFFITILFKRGNFTCGDVMMLASVISLMSSYLFFIGYYGMYYKALYALKLTRAIVKNLIISAVVSIVLNFIFAKFFGIYGLAFVTVLNIYLITFLNFRSLGFVVNDIKKTILNTSIYKIILTGFLMFVSSLFIKSILGAYFYEINFINSVINIVLLGIFSFIIFFIIAFWLEIDELKLVLSNFKTLLKV